MGLDMYLIAEVRLSEFTPVSTDFAERDGSYYIGGWKHMGEDRVERYRSLLESTGVAGAATPDSPAIDIEPDGDGFKALVYVGYWRKANAIHGWFVDNVQGGVDDCETYRVTREQLHALRALCQLVLTSAEVEPGTIHTGTTYYPDGGVEEHRQDGVVLADTCVAEELLPVRGGFFFGSTAYDEYYLQDLGATIDQIDRVLDAGAQTLYYRSSW